MQTATPAVTAKNKHEGISGSEHIWKCLSANYLFFWRQGCCWCLKREDVRKIIISKGLYRIGGFQWSCPADLISLNLWRPCRRLAETFIEIPWESRSTISSSPLHFCAAFVLSFDLSFPYILITVDQTSGFCLDSHFFHFSSATQWLFLDWWHHFRNSGRGSCIWWYWKADSPPLPTYQLDHWHFLSYNRSL